MDGCEISAFCFRLAALWLWMGALLQTTFFPALISTSDQDRGRASLIAYATGVLLQVLLGTFLWRASPRLARKTLGGREGVPFRGAPEIGALALRLAGVWLADRSIHAAWDVVFQAQVTSSTRSPSPLVGAIVTFAIIATSALVLVLGGGRIARRLFGPVESAGSLARELQPVAFSVLGLWIFFSALPVLVSNAASSRSWTESGEGWFVSTGGSPIVVATWLRLALGLGLFLGTGSVARFWRWAQTAGVGPRSTTGTGPA